MSTSAMYQLGRQARSLGYGREACNISNKNSVGRIKRAFWLAGYHDQDQEMDTRAAIKAHQEAE